MIFGSTAWAQGATPHAPGLLEQLMPFVFIFVIFYFLLIRPQRTRQKAHQNFLSGLKRGDSVITASGILGTIEGITEQYVTLEIAPDVRVRMLKSQVASPVQQAEDKK